MEGESEARSKPAAHRAQLSDPRQLRALAHPLRLQLLAQLRKCGPATATALAARVGESPALVSYHLRSLANYGFAEKAQELARDGRERWWRAVHEGMMWSPSDFLETPEGASAASALMREIADGYAEAAYRWLSDVPSWPREWVAAAEMSDWPLELSLEQTNRLREELGAVMERYAAESRDPKSEIVRVIIHVLPERRRGGAA